MIEDSSILKESKDLSAMSQSQKKKQNKSETPPLNDTTELSQSSKKKKLKNVDSPAKSSDPAPEKVEDVSSVKKKKKKDGNDSITNGKLFEVPSDWDTPLQPEEQVLNYLGFISDKKYFMVRMEE